MIFDNHLFLEEKILLPASDWIIEEEKCWQFVRVSRGQGYWLGRSQRRVLETGDVIIVPPLVRGEIRASQLGEMTLHYFQFIGEMLLGLLTLSERRYLEASEAKIRLPPRFLAASHPLSQQFEALCKRKPGQNTLRQRGRMLELVGAVFENKTQGKENTWTRLTVARERFYDLINSMAEGEIVRYTPRELAQRCGYSLRHFGRLFRNHLGISIREQQSRLRLEKAGRLLRETDSKIVQIAMESGYRHVSLFNALFKRHFGMTPRQYRQRMSKPRE